MAGYPYFAFVDESGVLSHDSSQPFFAIGMLLIRDCSELYRKLNRFRGEAIRAINADSSTFEFKFSKITVRNRPFYEQCITALFETVSSQVYVFVLDKRDPNVCKGGSFRNPWDHYIHFTKQLIDIYFTDYNPGEQCIVLADHFPGKQANRRYFEEEVRLLPSVLNATMLESKASLFIQLIDIITGAVVFDFRRAAKSLNAQDPEKAAVADHIRNYVGGSSLAGSFTLFAMEGSVRFQVWRYTPA